jgi:hypothetical protein
VTSAGHTVTALVRCSRHEIASRSLAAASHTQTRHSFRRDDTEVVAGQSPCLVTHSLSPISSTGSELSGEYTTIWPFSM